MEENRIDRAKRFSKIFWKSRADAGVSQEYMALGLGVSKKTIQNWEKGTSSPTLFQASEWFHLLGINPMPYYYEFVYPNTMNQEELSDGQEVSNERVSEALDLIVAEMPIDLKRDLLFLFHGKHGSSPYAVMQMVLAHLQVPMKDRVTHASIILQDYEIAKELGKITNPEHIQPRLEYLRSAVQFGRTATINKKSGYSLNTQDEDPDQE